jgi:hypothetical protein
MVWLGDMRLGSSMPMNLLMIPSDMIIHVKCLTHRRNMVEISIAAGVARGLCWILLFVGCLSAWGCSQDEKPKPPPPPAESDVLEELERRSRDEGWTFDYQPRPDVDVAADVLPPGFGGYEPPDNWDDMPAAEPTSEEPLPPRFDWRDKGGVVGPIRNQEDCGSCWAFASCGVAESVHAIAGLDLPDLSEQWLVDCNTHGWGCNVGGHIAFAYFVNRSDSCGNTGGGIEEHRAPYTGTQGECSCSGTPLPPLADWGIVSYPDSPASADKIKRAIRQYGPVMADIMVDLPFILYTGGVYNNHNLSTPAYGHAVVITGWDDGQGAEGIWFVRNSYGPLWGDLGTMRIEYGASRIATMVAALSSEPMALGESTNDTSDGDGGSVSGGSEDAEKPTGESTGETPHSDGAESGSVVGDETGGASGGSGVSGDGKSDGGSVSGGSEGAEKPTGESTGGTPHSEGAESGSVVGDETGGASGGTGVSGDGENGNATPPYLDEVAVLNQRIAIIEQELEGSPDGVLPPTPEGAKVDLDDLRLDLAKLPPLAVPLVGIWKQVDGSRTPDLAPGGYDTGYLLIAGDGLLEFVRYYGSGKNGRGMPIRTRLDWKADGNQLVVGSNPIFRKGRLKRELQLQLDGGDVRVTVVRRPLPASVTWAVSEDHLKLDGKEYIRIQR